MAVTVRSAEEREEYQRVSTRMEKGLSVIQEELHRMRMATKAQVDSLAIEREVRRRSHFTRALTTFHPYEPGLAQGFCLVKGTFPWTVACLGGRLKGLETNLCVIEPICR